MLEGASAGTSHKYLHANVTKLPSPEQPETPVEPKPAAGKELLAEVEDLWA